MVFADAGRDKVYGGDGDDVVHAGGGCDGIATSWGSCAASSASGGCRRPTCDPAPFTDEGPERVEVRDLGCVVFATGFRPDDDAWLP